MAFRTLTAVVMLATMLGAASAADEDRLVQDSRAAAKELGERLKSKLVAALGEGGPVQAVQVCSEIAPALAADLSAAKGLEVGRTSLRYRNPDNAPDAWERAVMERFQARKAAGEDPKALEYHEIVEQDGQRVFRYMKAIPTAEVCTTCHGETIAAPIAAKIDEIYPQDQARGFEPGDLRGAFTVSRKP